MTRTLSRSWLRSAFNDLEAVSRPAMLSAIAVYTRRVMAAKRESLAETLLNGAIRLDDGSIRVRGQKLRSYVDIAVQLRIVRAVIEYMTNDPLELVQSLLEQQPDSRVLLLVKGEMLLDRGDRAAAIEPLERALRIQSVCITAQQLLLRAKQVDYDLTARFCHMPFTHMSTGLLGETFACTCPSWVPFSIGNVNEAESADAIWNSAAAQEIRRSILDGDFSYCSRTQCSFISAQKLPLRSEITRPKLRNYIDNRVTHIDDAPELLELNHEPTCNLACPSCRTDIIAAKSEDLDLYARASERVILPMLKRVEGRTYITGGGEPFASKHFRTILRSLNRAEYPGLKVFLITNGLLVTPHRWSEFPDLPEMLNLFSVSIDAARPETYEQLRRPGKWATLTKNLQFIAGLRRANVIPSLCVNFVVQQANFREMLEFIDLADSLSSDLIWFQRVVNYGAYDEATFAKIDVAAPSHPEHGELLQILRNPLFERPSINKQMLLSIVPEWVGSDEPIDYLY